jgi:hypothetical protein
MNDLEQTDSATHRQTRMPPEWMFGRHANGVSRYTGLAGLLAVICLYLTIHWSAMAAACVTASAAPGCQIPVNGHILALWGTIVFGVNFLIGIAFLLVDWHRP